MSFTPRKLQAYQKRAQDFRISITTDETTTDFSSVEFHSSTIVKTGLTADDTTTGFDVDFTLTAADLDVNSEFHPWELRAMLAGEMRTLARGSLEVFDEPTES